MFLFLHFLLRSREVCVRKPHVFNFINLLSFVSFSVRFVLMRSVTCVCVSSEEVWVSLWKFSTSSLRNWRTTSGGCYFHLKPETIKKNSNEGKKLHAIATSKQLRLIRRREILCWANSSKMPSEEARKQRILRFIRNWVNFEWTKNILSELKREASSKQALFFAPLRRV